MRRWRLGTLGHRRLAVETTTASNLSTTHSSPPRRQTPALQVLQAFLCELDRLGLKPRLDISMVALGSKSDSLIAKAVTAVYPDRLAYCDHAIRPVKRGHP